MPVETLPRASWQTALALGFTSSVFDNIPLTALALKQGGYDWGYLAYAVGSAAWWSWSGSTAAVATAALSLQGKSAGWGPGPGGLVAAAYVLGLAVLSATLAWHPN